MNAAGSLREGSTRRWLAVWLWVAALFVSTPLVRGVTLALRQHELLGASVTLAYGVALLCIVRQMVFDVRLSDRAAFLALVVLAAIVGGAVLGLRVPEERVHFLQFGVLALLARWAWAGGAAPGAAVVRAFFFAGSVGIVEELFQAILPDRVFDLRDIGLNIVGVVFALLGDELLYARLGWRETETT